MGGAAATAKVKTARVKMGKIGEVLIGVGVVKAKVKAAVKKKEHLELAWVRVVTLTAQVKNESIRCGGCGEGAEGAERVKVKVKVRVDFK